jgi:uncharacterized protein
MDAPNSDLVFNVAQLLKEPVGSTRKLNLDIAALALDDAETGEDDAGSVDATQVTGHAKVTRIGDGLLVQGDVAADVEVECSRCLERISMPVEGTLEEHYQPTVDVVTGAPVNRADYEVNDAAFDIDANHMMDLSEPVRQALLVSMPMKPLCRADCRGLCPQCGANWNEGPCDCRSESVDNRWSGLRELRLDEFPAGDASHN